jgi:HEAT repeat protein
MTAGPPLAHLLLLIRHAPDAKVPLLAAFCRLIGPALIVPLVSALAIEESRLAVRRMRDILIAFGEAAREPVKMLRASSNPAVRRTAVEVLRALGGESALSELQTLLTDPHTEVQREALRAIFEIGSEQAYALLEHALTAGGPRRRQAVIQTLSAMSDERAAPLFVHVLSHSSPSGAGAPVYLSAIEALGRCGAGRLGVATLKSLLYGGAWYAPLRTARIRAAAARALRNTGSLDAQSVLEAASTGGSRGVRRAAQIALMLPQRSFPRGNPP